MKKIRLGEIHADHLTFEEAIDSVAEIVRAGQGGYVVTPNVDHVVLAETDAELREAYHHASLSLIDGMPLLWLTRLLGHPLPEKISGSDFVKPLMARAAKEGWRVFFCGAAPGVAAQAYERLAEEWPDLICAGVDSPPMGFIGDPEGEQRALDNIRAASPDVVLMAFGCPAQELLMYRWRAALAPAVALGIGASLDFIAGVQQRAPEWMARGGVEWLYRLAHDPRRLAHRYLVRDRAILPIAWRSLRRPWRARCFYG